MDVCVGVGAHAGNPHGLFFLLQEDTATPIERGSILKRQGVKGLRENRLYDG